MSQTTGRVTLPSEDNFLEETKEMMRRWGADALRDSDGTSLSDDIKKLDAKIYSTYFVSRGYNDHAKEHMDECQHFYLMSKHNLAVGETLTISVMEGYLESQVTPDYDHDPKRWWEVMDRTLNCPVPPEVWDFSTDEHTVILNLTEAFHEYTVSFLAYAIWDPTQMYNHITNNWGDKPHDIPFDVRGTYSGKYVKENMARWLLNNPDTDVVRFTTFFYHFTLVFNHDKKEKFVDWFGYGASVSPEAFEEFEKKKGYALRPEDIVDNGYYNTAFRCPTKAYLDYMDFVQCFVAERAGELVTMVHDAGKEAMMFLGDNWIGTEPYGRYFGNIGLDAVVGSVGGGTTLRMISEIPGVKYTEGRFLPYFFPDTFYEGNDPRGEAIENWISARRAILRKPVDRIGYGGYLSLAYKFPDFVDCIEGIADEFRLIYNNIAGVKPFCGLNVVILNAWGKLRSWQTFMVAHAVWYKQIYSYMGILEALSGSAVKVSFLSFEDIKMDGIPGDIDVIINAGDAGTAFSGGRQEWLDPALSVPIKKWIHNGGGFIGIGEPTAAEGGGHYFQLAEALGVDKELGYTLSTDKYYDKICSSHFILEDTYEFDFGESMKNVYAIKQETEILEYSNGEIHLSASHYGAGTTVYIAGLPYSKENTRLILRSMYYAAGKESMFRIWHANNLNCEVNAYPEAGKYAVINNSGDAQNTLVYDGEGLPREVMLKPYEIIWETI